MQPAGENGSSLQSFSSSGAIGAQVSVPIHAIARATRRVCARPSHSSGVRRTIRGARPFDWAAPVVPESATVEPSFAPTVGELLESLGSADFASQARRKLRALDLYQSPPNRRPEIFDDPELIKRGRFIA